MTLQVDTIVWMLHIADVEGVKLSDNDFDLLTNISGVITIEGENIVDYVPQIYNLNSKVEQAKKKLWGGTWRTHRKVPYRICRQLQMVSLICSASIL
ncbi:MAG: hypothetical protein IJ379_03585 [Lachnospiraceae bacterium]|nr:hypothetical protein [Lachnospiraceae bacterium]